MTTPALYDDGCAPQRQAVDLAMYVHLKEHLEVRIAALDRRMEDQAATTGRALAIAADASDVKFHAANHVREQLREQTAVFASREALTMTVASFNTQHDMLMARVSVLEAMSANLQGRIWAFGAGLTLLFALLQIGLHFWGTK